MAFAANAAACCFTVAMLLTLRKDQLLLSAPVPKRKGMLREGLNYALGKPTIYWPWLMAGFIAVFAMSLPVLAGRLRGPRVRRRRRRLRPA